MRSSSIDPLLSIWNADAFFALLSFIYIHAAPLAEVKRASRAGKAAFRDAVEDFAETIPLEELLPAGARARLESNQAQSPKLKSDA